jgi:hypothetical protein
MGDGAGNLIPSGLNNFVYVTIADKAVSVFDNRVAPQYGVKVWVGYASEEPTLFQVLSTRSETPAGVEQGFVGYAPAKRYEWNAEGGGQDPLNVHLRAFSRLKTGMSKIGGMYANLYKGYIHNGTDFLAIATQDIDLSSHIPATTGKAVLVMISIDDTGAVIETEGAETDLTNIKLPAPLPDIIPYLPAIPADTIFISGAVRVYNGQTEVREGRVNTDFVDLRFAWNFATGGGGGGSVDSVTGDGVDNTDPANPVLSYAALIDGGSASTY